MAELTHERYLLLLEAIEMATRVDELAAIRREIRTAYAGDERVRHIEQLIDAHARLLMDEADIDDE